MTGRTRPRVVHLTTTDMSLDWLLRPQLQAFAAAGFEVVGVAAPSGHAAGLRAAGVEVVPLRHATRAVAPARDVAALAELVRVFRRLRPDIVHTHNPKPGVYGRLAARLAGVPVVVNTQHGLYATADDRRARRVAVYAAERLAATCSDVELVQNPEDLETLARLRVPRDRLVRLGNGVDLTVFDPQRWASTRSTTRAALGVGSDDVMIGVVGRLVWEKGYATVFDAARRLAASAPAARVVVVGPDDDDKADGIDPVSRRAAQARGVAFLGRRDDMPELYAAMDLYVLASRREGFPRSAMEAAAMGLPVVTTDARGCREVVRHRRTGLLVPVDDAGALAGALTELVADPAMRRAYGDAGRVLAEAEFDQQRVIDVTLATYRRLLDAARSV